MHCDLIVTLKITKHINLQTNCQNDQGDLCIEQLSSTKPAHTQTNTVCNFLPDYKTTDLLQIKQG